MANITYHGVGQATEAEMDEVETTGKNWRDGQDKILNNVDKRFGPGAVQLALTWTIPDDQVEETMDSLDSAIAGVGADLPLASDGAATVDYDD